MILKKAEKKKWDLCCFFVGFWTEIGKMYEQTIKYID